ncbi:terpene synthase [Streptomyces durbertensis]|uniref:Terpene synthase n=1 Tax=Streptomyces durbertensis TaxID=2448886 RepID=A0ABR6EK01_9ACTN|nr:selina-4(15),7(11)-diene synthase [Streptomyces durbertensis]MBB1245651.1 terpene synthase [Streptomyces durbertensis]
MEPGPIVPPIFTPLAPAIHPRHARIDAQTAVWAETFGIGSPRLRKRLVTQDIGTFAARILPEGREEVARLLADFVLWLFGVDDGYCEEGELGHDPGELAGALHRLLRVGQNPQAPMLVDDALADGLRDLRLRVDEYGTPAQTTRWLDALREYFFSVVWEAAHRRTGTVPDLNDYTLMRLYDGATTVVLPMLELGHGYELRPEERDDTAVRAVAEAASFVITWDNDLFSHHKESRADGYYLNVVRVLQHHEGLTPDEAVARAVNQRDRAMVLFTRLRERLLEDASPELSQYLTSLGHYIRGAQDWGITSLRYTTPDDPAPLPTVFSDTPTEGSDEPLDIPAVAWWWDMPRTPAGTHVGDGTGLATA